MKGTVRVISGFLKGRVIPFHISKSHNADITPQKVKGALFSLLGERLTGKTFIDLYSGSGQIGIEALSRDCGLVIFNEKDKRRLDLIRDFLTLVYNGDSVILLNLNASTALKYLSCKGICADIIYLDPPYQKEKGQNNFYISVLEQVSLSGILNEASQVIVQHFTPNELPVSCNNLLKKEVKKYGATSLSIYSVDAVTGTLERQESPGT